MIKKIRVVLFGCHALLAVFALVYWLKRNFFPLYDLE